MLQRALLAKHALSVSARRRCLSSRWRAINGIAPTALPGLRGFGPAVDFHRCNTTTAIQHNTSNNADPQSSASKIERQLPVTCPGCGAPSQTVDSTSAGYYGPVKAARTQQNKADEDAVFAAAIARGAMNALPEKPSEVKNERVVCDRCHYLVHQSAGTSIIHPSTESIRAIIEESPHRHNHIYHVMDAADFPMSLIKNLQSALQLPKFRTQNRRSKTVKYVRGRTAEVSFIITRSDLLAPTKEQVDRLKPYMQNVLRDALHREHKGIRLGNMSLVSAKRGWWTKNLKEEIYNRGGAGWMVGKVNVGKSALVEEVYPKGRMQTGKVRPLWRTVTSDNLYQPPALPPVASNLDEYLQTTPEPEPRTSTEFVPRIGEKSAEEIDVSEADEDDFHFDESELSLLPPVQPEVQYPNMPIVSALPGTTASPIRIPFGSGKGELIDLPGIERSVLESFVKPEHRKAMIMNHRVVPEQQVLKPGQSLLLGGLIRITPKTPDLVFLSYAFVPQALKPHVTSTEKAVAIHTGRFSGSSEEYTGHVETHATERAKDKMESAGVFGLKWDVTKARAGPVTAKAAGNIRTQYLPYVVYSLDLLIEGVGWVEIVAQVRRKQIEELTAVKRYNPFNEGQENETSVPEFYPEIEVFSPNGKFVGVRQPMGAWQIGGPKKTPVHERKKRPRQTISFHKRKEGGRLGSLRKQAAMSEGG